MPLREDLLNPIPGENPSGSNLRYAGVYDKIKEARREDDDANQGEWKRERKLADFPLVIKLASESIALKSKDLQLAAWLTEALLRAEGFSGLRAGLGLIQGLIENFWDTLYPELEDGDAELRAAPVDWVGSRLEQAVKNAPITRSGYNWFQFKQSRAVGYEADAAESATKGEAREAAIADGKVTAEDFDEAFKTSSKIFYVQSRDNLDACLTAIESLQEVCEPRFGNCAPGFGTLRSALEEVRQTVNILLQKKRETEPDAESEAEAAPVEAVSEDADGDATPAVNAPARAKKTVTEEPIDKDDAARRVAAVARYLRREDPYSPAPYLMLRGLRWGELRAAGDSPGLDVLAPPPTEIRQQLKQQAVDGLWQEVLETAETAVGLPCGRAWLDVQRYATRAATELGYEAIAGAIRSEVRGLVADLAGLPTWTLADDTPTANAETQAWLRELAPAPAVQHDFETPMNGEPAAPVAPGEAPAPDPFTLAMQAARSGDLSQAMEILSREIAHERSGRARFQRKVQLAQICMSTGNEAIAHPILDEMATEIERLKLEEWESAEVIAHPLTLLFRCLNKIDGENPDVKRKLYARICRLDPMQALAVSK